MLRVEIYNRPTIILTLKRDVQILYVFPSDFRITYQKAVYAVYSFFTKSIQNYFDYIFEIFLMRTAKFPFLAGIPTRVLKSN